MALTDTQAYVSIQATHTSSVNLGSASRRVGLDRMLRFAEGAGAGQVNKIFADRRTLSASASEDLDLSGTLTDVFGAVINLTEVKAILVIAASGNTNNVVLGGASATQFVGPFGAATHTIAVPPGGVFYMLHPGANGWEVSAGVSDLLKVANSGAGTSVTYDIVILGS
jgi:hypothetical protein